MFVAILTCPLSTIRVQFARAVFATRATLVAHGNLSNTPRGLTQIGNTNFIYNSIIIIIIDISQCVTTFIVFTVFYLQTIFMD